MACFTISVVEAVAVTAVKKHAEKKEKKNGHSHENRIPFSRKLGWLTRLLLGGSVLLAFEHVWHGEIVPWFPFLTAMSDPSDAAEMFHEMATVGVCMALLLTAVWGVMCLIADTVVKHSEASDAESAK